MAFARRRVDDAAADDVVAETFLVAWRRLDDVPPRPLPWLYGVAHRVLANHYRGVARRDRLATRVSAVAPRAALPSEVDGDDVVPAAFAGLSPRDREVLALAAWEELDAVEIALVLGCSPNAAALRLSRARQRFRLALTTNEGGRTQRERKRSDA